ncbi:MAG: RHS repeat-associated core domain-containing protein, partial [bacterium]|nr:RHS repeat-associated core domain-containing protein [bacterium]
GNVMFLTDSNGNKVAEYVQEGFGNVLATSGSLTSDFWHLTSKQQEPETGLYFFYARWYDPVVGRFITRDPIPCIAPYTYVKNNPIRFTDPSGFSPADELNYSIYEFRFWNPPSNFDEWGNCYTRCLEKWHWNEVCGIGGGVGGGSVIPRGWIGKICRRVGAITLGWCSGISYGCMISCGRDYRSY